MRSITTLIILLTFMVLQASAQQTSNVEKIDSIVALLPRLSGDDRLSALATLTNLTAGLPTQKQFTYLYLQEARRQKNITAESAALLKLTLYYYPRFDSDSIFIIGEEAVRFARQHNKYDDMFFAQSEIIRRYKAEGRLLIALRKAEEAYAEAKIFQENRFMARTLSTLGEILCNMDQYEEAIKNWVESIALAKQDGQAPNELFILEHYDLLALVLNELNRLQESLNYADSMQIELDRLQRDLPDYNLQRYHFFMAYHHAMAYAKMKQPERALEAIRSAEAVYDPQWNERNPSFAAQIDNLYAEYNCAAGNYGKALELFYRILRFDEGANRESAVVEWKKRIAQVQREKGDYQAAAELYDEVIKKQAELKKEQYYAQLGELRTIYELDKSEIESERRLAALLRMRVVIAGLVVTCLVLLLVAGLTVWSRRRIAEKNRGLYLKIKEQDRLEQALVQMTELYHASRPKATVTQESENVTGKIGKISDETSESGNKTGDVETGESGDVEIGESGDVEIGESSDAPAVFPADEYQHRHLVNRFHQYLLRERHYANSDIDLDMIITQLATNRTYLFRAFKSVRQKTPLEYINDIKLAEAKKMLETHYELTLEEIWESCGFNSRSAFYRLFRDRYRISPAAYRKISRNPVN